MMPSPEPRQPATPKSTPKLPKQPPPGFGIPEKRGSIPGDNKVTRRRPYSPITLMIRRLLRWPSNSA